MLLVTLNIPPVKVCVCVLSQTSDACHYSPFIHSTVRRACICAFESMRSSFYLSRILMLIWLSEVSLFTGCNHTFLWYCVAADVPAVLFCILAHHVARLLLFCLLNYSNLSVKYTIITNSFGIISCWNYHLFLSRLFL